MALPVLRRDRSSQPVQVGEPFSELEQLHERMGELVNSVLLGAGLPNGGSWSPPVDIEETEDAWIVEAELPGARQEDVNVELRGSELEISGEIVERERQGILRRRTRRVGRFDYRVSLPGLADATDIDATLADGVLTVRVPKPEQARPRRIAVKAE
jgi:HSP20 family protein